jgi:hypothetical protein
MSSRGESKTAGSMATLPAASPTRSAITIADLVGEEIALIHECKSPRFGGTTECLQMSSGAELYPTSGPAGLSHVKMLPWYFGYQPPVASGAVATRERNAEYFKQLSRLAGARMLSANSEYSTLSSPGGSSIVFDDRTGKPFIVSAPNIEVIPPKQVKLSFKLADFQMYGNDGGIVVYTWGAGAKLKHNGINLAIPSAATIVSVYKNADGSYLLIPEIPQLEAITSAISATGVVSAPLLMGSLDVYPADDNFVLVSDTNFQEVGPRGPNMSIALAKGRYKKLNVYSIDVSPGFRAYKIVPSQ